MCVVGFLRLQWLKYKNYRENRHLIFLINALHNPTKKAWRKSLRHAPIKENLIVKIEISDF